MNLQPIKVEPRHVGLRVRCSVCGAWPAIEIALADLDGPAFAAYYCVQCSETALEGAKRYPADFQPIACEHNATGSQRPGTRSHANAD
jgi:hypothetical protein